MVNSSSFVDTLSPLTAALHVVDWILCFLSCTVGTWSFWFISTERLYLESLTYIKKQQEYAEAQTKQYHHSNQQWKPVLTFCLACSKGARGGYKPPVESGILECPPRGLAVQHGGPFPSASNAPGTAQEENMTLSNVEINSGSTLSDERSRERTNRRTRPRCVQSPNTPRRRITRRLKIGTSPTSEI